MTPRPRPHWPREIRATARAATARVAAVGALLALALLAGCSDGYPSDDLDQTSPFDMSNPQRLRALNGVAAKAHRQERPRFALDAGPGREREAGCRLGVTLRRDGEPTVAQHHTLRAGMDAVVAHSDASGSFEVHLVDGTGADARRLGVLMRSASWTHATQADLLVQLMIRDCAARAAPSDARESVS